MTKPIRPDFPAPAPAAYISKEETPIPLNDPSGKWSDLYLLPEWEEEFYNVYTVKKHGKWVMLKALKKEYADIPEYREMLEKEFDVRYNLCHPNIVMVNDLEVVPEVGMAIITDDVYGYSLRRLIDEKRLTPRIVERLQTQLLDAMEYIQENHVQHSPITPETIIFTEYNENLKLTNVGYAKSPNLTSDDTRADIAGYGRVVNEVLDRLPTSLPLLRKVANKCEDPVHGFRTVADLQLAMERRTSSQIFLFLCIFITLMALLLCLITMRG